jgi:hypothetical protein
MGRAHAAAKGAHVATCAGEGINKSSHILVDLPISLPDQLLVPARPARFARNCDVGAWPLHL